MGISKTVTYPSGVIFAFDAEYETGQFINGDWYVVAPSGVTINSITPDTGAGRNGFAVNESDTRNQPYDDRQKRYLAGDSLPLLVQPNSSILKAVSLATPNQFTFLQSAEALTVLATAPAAGSFRPAYFGANKTLFNINTIDVSSLGILDKALVSSADTWSFTDIKNRYQGVQIDHTLGWLSRYLHPVDHYPGAGHPEYGSSIARDNGVSVLRFLLNDFDYSIQEHKDALHNYLQMAIDIKGIADGGGFWPADGGHMIGRKLPPLFAGKILNEPSFYTTVANTIFDEDDHIYRSSVTGMALYGKPARKAYDYWIQEVENRGSKDVRDPYGYIDGGGAKYVGSSYAYCCTFSGWKYAAIAADVLNLRVEWGHPEFFEYVERWQEIGAHTLPDPIASYDGVPGNFGSTWGGDPVGIEGSGRSPERHGINAGSGLYGHAVGNEMYQFYNVEIPILEPIPVPEPIPDPAVEIIEVIVNPPQQDQNTVQINLSITVKVN